MNKYAAEMDAESSRRRNIKPAFTGPETAAMAALNAMVWTHPLTPAGKLASPTAYAVGAAIPAGFSYIVRKSPGHFTSEGRNVGERAARDAAVGGIGGVLMTLPHRVYTPKRMLINTGVGTLLGGLGGAGKALISQRAYDRAARMNKQAGISDLFKERVTVTPHALGRLFRQVASSSRGDAPAAAVLHSMNEFGADTLNRRVPSDQVSSWLNRHGVSARPKLTSDPAQYSHSSNSGHAGLPHDHLAMLLVQHGKSSPESRIALLRSMHQDGDLTRVPRMMIDQHGVPEGLVRKALPPEYNRAQAALSTDPRSLT